MFPDSPQRSRVWPSRLSGGMRRTGYRPQRRPDRPESAEQSVDCPALKIKTKQHVTYLWMEPSTRANGGDGGGGRQERRGGHWFREIRRRSAHPECTQCLTASVSPRAAEYLKDPRRAPLQLAGWEIFQIAVIRDDSFKKWIEEWKCPLIYFFIFIFYKRHLCEGWKSDWHRRKTLGFVGCVLRSWNWIF